MNRKTSKRGGDERSATDRLIANYERAFNKTWKRVERVPGRVAERLVGLDQEAIRVELDAEFAWALEPIDRLLERELKALVLSPEGA